MLIKSGSRGPHVRSFQQFLRDTGIEVGSPDGVAGPRTVNGIKSFQLFSGLTDDGVAGEKTLSVARASGWDWGKPTPEQIEAAEALGVELAVVQAIESVESGGNPRAVRFEPHVFLRKRPGSEEQIPFTRGPSGFSVVASETDLEAFRLAYSVDPEIAVERTSWGLFQVMGVHLVSLFGGDVELAVVTFDLEPERTSFRLLVRWFEKNPRALMAAAAKDWSTLARRYNGPGQVARYSKLLESAYAEFV